MLLRRISQESLPRFFLSTQVPQASEEDAPGGTDGLRSYREVEHQSFADAGPSKDMHTELLAEANSQHDCYQLQSLEYEEYEFRRYPS
jgi:hypothetical protein